MVKEIHTKSTRRWMRRRYIKEENRRMVLHNIEKIVRDVNPEIVVGGIDAKND